MKTCQSPARPHTCALFVAVCLSGAAAAAAPVLPTGGASQDSVSYQINAAHTGSIDFTQGFSAPLKQLWSTNLGGAVSYPLTADGMTFVTVGMSGSVLLEALSLSTGAVEWEKLLPGSNAWADAAYDHGTVFVITGSGQLVAFRAVSGKKLWSAQIPGQNNYYGAPVAQDGIVVVQYQSQSYTDSVGAFDEKTGASKWTSAPGGNYSNSNIGSIGAIGTNGVFISNSSAFYRLSPADGSTTWTASQNCTPSDAPVLTSRSVYTTTNYYNCSGSTIYDPVSGAVKGEFVGANAPVVLGKNRIVVSLSGTLYDYSPTNDSVYWTFSGDGYMNSKPVGINGYVAAMSGYGTLYLLDGATGAEYWSTTLNSNGNNGGGPDTGLGAGEGALLVPYGTYLYAFVPQNAR